MGLLKVPSTSILSEQGCAGGWGGDEEESNWTSRLEKPAGTAGVSRRGHSQPYCLINKLKGGQMEGCSHGFCTAAWTQCIKTHSDPRS